MTDHGLDLERPYDLGDPLDMTDARTAARRAARMRRDAESAFRTAVTKRAQAEGAYRQALAKQIVVMKTEHGATAAKELAHDDADVKAALIAFRVAEGMVDAHKERLKSLEGERSMLKSLIDWSATIANVLRQAGGLRHEPDAADVERARTRMRTGRDPRDPTQ